MEYGHGERKWPGRLLRKWLWGYVLRWISVWRVTLLISSNSYQYEKLNNKEAFLYENVGVYITFSFLYFCHGAISNKLISFSSLLHPPNHCHQRSPVYLPKFYTYFCEKDKRKQWIWNFRLANSMILISHRFKVLCVIIMSTCCSITFNLAKDSLLHTKLFENHFWRSSLHCQQSFVI